MMRQRIINWAIFSSIMRRWMKPPAISREPPASLREMATCTLTSARLSSVSGRGGRGCARGGRGRDSSESRSGLAHYNYAMCLAGGRVSSIKRLRSFKLRLSTSRSIPKGITTSVGRFL